LIGQSPSDHEVDTTWHLMNQKRKRKKNWHRGHEDLETPIMCSSPKSYVQNPPPIHSTNSENPTPFHSIHSLI